MTVLPATEPNGRTALIFGVSGQDGGYLAHLLLSKGYVVHGTSRNPAAVPFGSLDRLGIRHRVTMHAAELSHGASLRSLLQSVLPDEIYNLAGQSSVALSFEQPVETYESITAATLNLLECVRSMQRPVRLFNAASSECFGETRQPADECTPFSPHSPYGVAKAAAFWATRNYRDAYGIHASSGILANHESPVRPNRYVGRKIVSTAVRIARGSEETLSLGNVSICRDWGLAADYVEAMWTIVQAATPDDYVIATGLTQSLGAFTTAVFGCLGLDASRYLRSDDTLLRPLDLQVSTLNPSKARRVLGWQATYRGDTLVQALVSAELSRSVGPLPWI